MQGGRLIVLLIHELLTFYSMKENEAQDSNMNQRKLQGGNCRRYEEKVRSDDTLEEAIAMAVKLVLVASAI